MEKIKIGVICPHRGDRANFLTQFKKYLFAQTMLPDEIIYSDYPPLSNEIDITQRYRRAYECLKNVDVILLMEVDDYYAPSYIETMITEWEKNNKPDIFGISSSVYYHISGKYFQINHPTRSSANTTLLKSNLKINWGLDSYPYTDIRLWEQINGKTFNMPLAPICVGIKHGIGLVGGGCHDEDSAHYTKFDKDGKMLFAIVGKENFEFYQSLKSEVLVNGIK